MVFVESASADKDRRQPEELAGAMDGAAAAEAGLHAVAEAGEHGAEHVPRKDDTFPSIAFDHSRRSCFLPDVESKSWSVFNVIPCDTRSSVVEESRYD